MYKIRIKETDELKEFYGTLEPDALAIFKSADAKIEKTLENLFNDSCNLIKEARNEYANRYDNPTRFSDLDSLEIWENLVNKYRNSLVSEIIPLENLIIEKV